MKRPLAALGFGLIVAVAGLAGVEILLRVLGLGMGAPQHDPFAGFSETVPSFEKTVDAAGVEIFRVARTRANPRRASEVLADPQRRFRAAKPEDGLRVFVVGGSSAAGVPYGPRWAFSGWLENLLEEALPGKPIEVVNAAFSGFASRRVLTVVEEIARYEPDLLVVYAGHNEFAEGRFYAHLVDLDPRVFRLWEWATSLRIYRLLSALLPVPSPADEPPQLDFETDNLRAIQMFAVSRERSQSSAGEESLVRERAYRDLHYEFNLRRMVETADEARARTFFVSLGQNLSDWAPGASAHGIGVSAAEREAVAAALGRGDAARDAGDCARGADAYQEAVANDPAYADAHFRLAGCLRATGRLEAADRHYRLASDLDRVPHGASSAFNELVEEVARDTGAVFVDAAGLLHSESGERLVGNDLFLDMVHPNLQAHQHIARAVFDAIQTADLSGSTWRATSPLPPPDQIHAQHPRLRLLEQQARWIACELAVRPECTRDAANAMLRLDPDDPLVRQMSGLAPEPGR